MEISHDLQADYPVNQPLTITFDVDGGREPYKLELFTGSLPAGLSMNNLTITGTPTTTGTRMISLRVSDSRDTVKSLFIKIKVI